MDDSSNVIAFSDHSQIKNYLNNYYKLIQAFYNINKLKINPEKTLLLLVYKNKFKNNLKDFYFCANGFKIVPTKIIKILGQYLRDDLKMDTQIGKLCGILHNRIFELKQVKKYTNFKTRLIFMNAHVIGKLNYLLPLYMGSTKEQLTKIHKVLMTASRGAIGDYCFKKSITYILNKCGWMSINKMIQCASINLIHKIIINKTPTPIFNIYKINRRSNVDIVTVYKPKNRKTEEFFLSTRQYKIKYLMR